MHLKSGYIIFTTSILIVGSSCSPEQPRKEALGSATKGAGIEWETLHQEAMRLHEDGQYDRAITIAKKALNVAEENVGANHPDLANSLYTLASQYHEQEKYIEAEPLFRRALAINEKVIGENHIDVAPYLDGLAVNYRLQWKFTEAELFHKQALSIRKNHLGDTHLDVAVSLNYLGILHHIQGQYSVAEPFHQHALEIRKDQLGKDHLDVALSEYNLAIVYHRLGKYEQAYPLFQHALKIHKDSLGSNHRRVLMIREHIAELQEDMKERTRKQDNPLLNVTINVRNCDVVEVLKAFSLQTGMSIVISPDVVADNVSVRLNNVPGEEALDRILTPHELSYRIVGGTVVVDRREDHISDTVENSLKPPKKSTTIQIGDSFDYVLSVLGEPSVDCPLKGGKHVLFYEAGEIHFLNNKVTSCSMLTAGQISEKREKEQQQRHQAERQRRETKNVIAGNLEKYNKSVRSREAQLKKRASELNRQFKESRAKAMGYMAKSASSFNDLADRADGTSRQRRALQELIFTNDPKEFYDVSIDVVYYGRVFRSNPSAALAFSSWSQYRTLFLEEYENMLRCEKAISSLLDELERIETKRDRIRRHGY